MDPQLYSANPKNQQAKTGREEVERIMCGLDNNADSSDE